MSAITMNQNVPVKRSRFRRACSKIKIALSWRKMSEKEESTQTALTAAAIALHEMKKNQTGFFNQDSKLVQDAASASTEFGSDNESSPSTITTDTTPMRCSLTLPRRSSLKSFKSMCSSVGNKSVRFSVDLEEIMPIATRKEIQEETERSKKEAMDAAMKRRAAYAKNNARDSLGSFGVASTKNSRLSTARDSINLSLATF